MPSDQARSAPNFAEDVFFKNPLSDSQALSGAMRPARADERGRARERGRGDDRRGKDKGHRGAGNRDDRGQGARDDPRRARGEKGRSSRPGEPSSRRRKPKTVWQRTFGQFNLKASQIAVLLSASAVVAVFFVWTLPSYLTYRERPQFTQQFCVVRAASNVTGCLSVDFLYVSDSVCDQSNEVTYDCSDLCVYAEAQRKARLASPGSDGLEATSEASRAAFAARYLVGAETPCWYPKGGGGFPDSLTLVKPNNPNAAMFTALIALAPFLIVLTASVLWMLKRPKAVEELEDSEMLTGLFEEVITGRDNQKRFAEEQEKKLRAVAAKVEGEAERRLGVVQEVEREKKERRENEDNLKHQVSENIRSLESRMISEMASRLAKIPLPKELKKKMGVDGKRGRDKYDSKERALKGDRPDSAASIYDDHQRDERRRRGALDDDVEAQRDAFQRRLGERRGRDGDRERSRGRSKSRPRR